MFSVQEMIIYPNHVKSSIKCTYNSLVFSFEGAFKTKCCVVTYVMRSTYNRMNKKFKKEKVKMKRSV